MVIARPVLVLALLLAGCGASNLVTMNRAALGAASLALVCDWRQTRDSAATGWTGRSQEHNPVLGDHPSVGKIDGYFMGAIALAGLAWYATPRRWRAATGSAIALGEATSIVGNVGEHFRSVGKRLGYCGMR